MTGKEFLTALADQLIAELRPNNAIRTFTTNPAVIGAYAEASVRQFVARVVFPMRVSTGAVISEQLCSTPDRVPQIDTIIWSPSPAPAIFCAGEFGLVPRGSSFGIMEIKRSAYTGVGKELEERLSENRVFDLVADVARQVADIQSDNERAHFPNYPGLGVVCTKENDRRDVQLENLVEKGRAVVLFDLTEATLQPNPKAVHRLVNFLILTRLRAKHMEGADLVNIPLLDTQA
jgi:hypothetical protein